VSGMDRQILKVCTLTGALLSVLYGCGVLLFARMIPVNSPLRSATEVVGEYQAHETGIRVGMALVMFGGAMMLTWGAALATLTRRAAPRHPILFHIQMAAAVTAGMNGVMLCLTGALASFRAGEVSEEITLVLNDLFWLLWVFPGATFEIWCIAAGTAILLDGRDRPVFPRWSGYFSLLVAFSFLPGFLGIFAKEGVLAYNGLLPWWIPTVLFFLWVTVMDPLMHRAIRDEAWLVEDLVHSDASSLDTSSAQRAGA